MPKKQKRLERDGKNSSRKCSTVVADVTLTPNIHGRLLWRGNSHTNTHTTRALLSAPGAPIGPYTTNRKGGGASTKAVVDLDYRLSLRHELRYELSL